MKMTKDSNLRILIIDDNPEIHKDFTKILTEDNSNENELDNFEQEIFGKKNEESTLPKFLIGTAYQGQEGVEKIAQAIAEGIPYALAFVDVRMPPGWDGIETIQHIWAIDPDIQVVICTAFSDYSWEETVEQLGQRENLLILKKPFDNVAVRQLSCALTKKWLMLQELNLHAKLLEERVHQRTTQLQQSLSVTRGTLESSADGVLVIDTNNVIIDYNNKLIELWNISLPMIETKDARHVLEYIAGQITDSNEFYNLINSINENSSSTKMSSIKCKNGSILEHYSQLYKMGDKIAGRVWSFRDVTKRALLEEELHHQSTHDALTGLPNRVLLMDRIHQAINRAVRHNTQFCLLFFDLDRFKLINDSISHAAGDELLQEVAMRIIGVLRSEDTCARLGGDEFVVVAEVVNEADAQTIANKVISVFTKPFNVTSCDIVVSASIGISVFPLNGNTIDELLSHADIAMYQAKKLGGNQSQYYNNAIGLQSVNRMGREAELRQAIDNEEFFLVYQPQLDIYSEKITSVEALIRWQHPTKGLILPIDFIPLAEETGLIMVIGEWVLRTACRQNKVWQDMGLAKIRVSVNLASQQLKQPNLVEKIKTILEEVNLEPCYLELELTENVIIDNIKTIGMISELNALGVNIALDDFGTGYSCLNYLRTLTVDRIKIDQSFIKTINTNRGDEAILKAIITMANSLNLKILAEGVETQNQLDFLRSKRCGEVQGYYFSKPLLANNLEDLMMKQESIKNNK
jgi:diguanylate cyclase (GGDEF)-like protein